MRISPPTASRFPELAVIKDHNEYQFLAYANVLLILWRGVQDPKVCSTAYDIAVDLAARNGVARVAVLSIIEPGGSAPSAEAREALARLHADPKHVVHRVAIVYRAEGFIASIVRSIALSIKQRSSRLINQEMFQTLDLALPWALEGLPIPPGLAISTAALRQALDEHRAAPSPRLARTG